MKFKLLLFITLILAFCLRTFQLSRFPPTLYGDEQAFAWNAYNILKLGQDEYGNSYPLQFRSFDDYKAPVPVYLLVPFIKYLGFNTFAIRFPIALASTISVFMAYLLSRFFLNRKTSLLISFLLAISPWHIHLSRGFFEATLSLLFFVSGIYFYIRNPQKLKYVLLSIIFFALTIYSYFTPRIILPVFFIFLFIYILLNNKNDQKILIKNSIVGLLLLIFLSLPLIKLTFFDKGFSRLEKLTGSQSQIVSDTVRRERYASNIPGNWRQLIHNKAVVWSRLIKNNYLDNLSPGFWYISGDSSLRYFTGNMGMFYLLEFPFFIIGLYSLWREKRKAALFFLAWIFIVPIPASLVGRPFAVRSLALLPAPFIFVGYGLYKSIYRISRHRINSLLKGLITAGFMISLASLLIRYYLEYSVYAATWWGWENKAAIDFAKNNENKYNNIFISNFYTGVTLAFAVYTAYDPLQYRYAVNHPVVLADGRHLVKLGKYYFGSLDLDKKRLTEHIIPPKSLYIGRPEEADSDEVISAPDDGRIIFKIYTTK